MATAPGTPAPLTPKAAKTPKAKAANPATKEPKAPKATPAAAAPPGAAPTPSLTPAAPVHAEIARRAYELWLAHGGSTHENWLEAERQLRR